MTHPLDPGPSRSTPSGDSRASPQPSPAEAASATGGAERYGPLTLVRYRKDDGRTLILYWDEEDGGGEARG